MKTAAQLADMTNEAFERYLKRHRLHGMAAFNLSRKRRVELHQRAIASDEDDVNRADAIEASLNARNPIPGY